MTTPLEQLLVVQEHDSAIDHLRHRRATLPERAALARAETVIRDLEAPIGEVRGRHDVVSRDVKRLEDEAASAAAKIAEVEASMYSGSITSPRELQAMQSEIEQLRRHQRALEDFSQYTTTTSTLPSDTTTSTEPVTTTTEPTTTSSPPPGP